MTRVLVVDDDEVFARVLAESLQNKGYAVEVVTRFDDVVGVVAETAIDAVLLDLMLGEQSSLPLIPEILAVRPDTRITVVTGFASIATTVQALKLGAVNYLAKPVGVRDVIAALEADAAEPFVEPDSVPTMPLRRVEWEHIQRVLAEHDGNVSAAARSLGIHRRSLQRKLAKRPPN